MLGKRVPETQPPATNQKCSLTYLYLGGGWGKVTFKTMIPPVSVGRIVHYNASANDEFPPRTLAALVTEVAEDGTVSLCCFGPRGLGFRSGISEGKGQSQWHWPARA